jgi:predicted O-methyltransferase YrrM
MPTVSRWQDIPSFEDPGEQIVSLYDLIVQHSPPGFTIVETGCYHGRSLVGLALTAKAANKGLRVIGVDWMEDMSAGLLPELRRNVERFGVGDIVELVAEDALQAAKRYEDGSLWFVFLDDGHDREHVAAEVEAWMPKIAPGGFLGGHDYRWHLVAEPVAAMLDTVLWEPEWPDIWLAPKQSVLDGDINLPTTIPKRAIDPTIRQYFERKKF